MTAWVAVKFGINYAHNYCWKDGINSTRLRLMCNIFCPFVQHITPKSKPCCGVYNEDVNIHISMVGSEIWV